jgi:hypothetical protein
MTDTRVYSRSLCADLVKLEWNDEAGSPQSAPAILEDISPRGACLQLEHPVPVNLAATLRHGDKWSMECHITYCVFREIGYFLGIEFKPGSRWSKRSYQPQHLLELDHMMLKPRGAESRALR